MKGWVDGAYLNPAVCKYVMKSEMNQMGALVFDPGLPHTKGSYFISTIKHAEVIKALNDFLSENKTAVDELVKKYHIDAEQ